MLEPKFNTHFPYHSGGVAVAFGVLLCLSDSWFECANRNKIEKKSRILR